jgi:DNA-directed RNA polymerase specialized sigma24 family protein
MPEESAFQELIRRVRAGDGAAAAELVRRYEPAVRRFVRVRLAHSPLRRLFDSADICQEVLGTFFVRAALGQYDVETPEGLVRLLIGIARKKVALKARRHEPEQANAPDGRPVRVAEEAVAAGGPSPSQEVALAELVEKARAQLSEEERRLAELRALGRPWGEIAAELSGSPDALRMKLVRAADRVTGLLRLEESCDE